MVKVSAITATRGRYNMLINFLESVFHQAHNPDEVEVVLGADLDDPQTRIYVDAYVKATGFNVRLFERERSPFLNRDYVSAAAKMANGKYIWGLGNDAEIITDGWDKIIWDEGEKFLADKPDGVAYIYINDDIHKPGVYVSSFVDFLSGCCYPVLTKRAVEVLGCFTPKEIRTWGADYCLWDIFCRTNKNRILDIRDKVACIHYSHHTGRIEQDEINKQIQANSDGGRLTELQTLAYVNKINMAVGI